MCPIFKNEEVVFEYDLELGNYAAAWTYDVKINFYDVIYNDLGCIEFEVEIENKEITTTTT